MIKRVLSFLTLLFVLILNSGCTKVVTIYVPPKYPKIENIEKVKSNYDSYIWKECLFIDDSNSSLCGDNLNKVLTTVSKLRINESTCRTVIKDYNDFTKKELQVKESIVYEFGF